MGFRIIMSNIIINCGGTADAVSYTVKARHAAACAAVEGRPILKECLRCHRTYQNVKIFRMQNDIYSCLKFVCGRVSRHIKIWVNNKMRRWYIRNNEIFSASFSHSALRRRRATAAIGPGAPQVANGGRLLPPESPL